MTNPGNKSFCVYPWIQMSRFNEDDVRLCSHALQPQDFFPGAKAGLVELFNSPYMKEVRRKMLAGEEVRECVQCRESEELGVESERLIQIATFAEKYSKTWTDHDPSVELRPKLLDLRIGNVCNLKCQSCSPPLSNQVGIERAAMNTAPDTPFFHPRQWPIGQSAAPAAQFTQVQSYDWDDLTKLMSSVDQVKVIGGEPLIAREMDRFLEICENSGRKNKIELSMHTNCTRFDLNFLEALAGFKRVKIHLSLDGHGKLNDYIRYPSRWETIEKNIDGYFDFASRRKNFRFGISTVLQIPNYLQILGFATWIYDQMARYPGVRVELSPISVADPDYLSVQYLPWEMKAAGIAKVDEFERVNRDNPELMALTAEWRELLRNILNSGDTIKTARMRQAFCDVTAAYDRHRGTDILQVFPEYKIFQNSIPAPKETGADLLS
jgi:hypothetical protein